ncbi:AzlD domain-containing protein [Mammaliicoccus sciuri]|uniref:AzlD domain-containing protein n=1 Tax=Mammaliicoccus sciuri TaxID=1296 RepID=A0AAJ4SIR9_MAMSC|nr:AzlD domain-containing protein [Mammaliicoccus sciuri]RTX73652.1 AzlD domain-containing protein [Mammaliicoccus sciuri]
MSISMYLILITVSCFVLTWIIRVSPFVLLSKADLPESVIKWLQYVPVCLFTALILEGMLNQEGNVGFTLNFESIIVAIPTILIALIFRSLTITVIAGMFIMAIVRLVF